MSRIELCGEGGRHASPENVGEGRALGPVDYIWQLLLMLGLGFVLTLVCEPIVMRWAAYSGIVDEPNWRRVNTRPVTGGGGLAFFPSLVLAFIVIVNVWPVFWQSKYFGLLVAAFLISVTGIVDDTVGMKASRKLLCQLAAGAVLYWGGYRIERVSLPLVNAVMELGSADLLLTVVGTAALINAINMLDGLDGLAAGSALIMGGFMLFHKVVLGSAHGAALLAVTMGIALAFLRYNSHPAKVFMGDTGSMFLGLILAAEMFDSASQGTAVATLLLPLAILGIPVFDMLRIMVTRAKESRKVFAADKSHIHHRLLALGLSHRRVVWLIYAMNVQIGIMATIYRHVTPAYRGLYLISIGLFLFIAFYLISSNHKRASRAGTEKGGGHGAL